MKIYKRFFEDYQAKKDIYVLASAIIDLIFTHFLQVLKSKKNFAVYKGISYRNHGSYIFIDVEFPILFSFLPKSIINNNKFIEAFNTFYANSPKKKDKDCFRLFITFIIPDSKKLVDLCYREHNGKPAGLYSENHNILLFFPVTKEFLWDEIAFYYYSKKYETFINNAIDLFNIITVLQHELTHFYDEMISNSKAFVFTIPTKNISDIENKVNNQFTFEFLSYLNFPHEFNARFYAVYQQYFYAYKYVIYYTQKNLKENFIICTNKISNSVNNFLNKSFIVSDLYKKLYKVLWKDFTIFYGVEKEYIIIKSFLRVIQDVVLGNHIHGEPVSYKMDVRLGNKQECISVINNNIKSLLKNKEKLISECNKVTDVDNFLFYSSYLKNYSDNELKKDIKKMSKYISMYIAFALWYNEIDSTIVKRVVIDDNLQRFQTNMKLLLSYYNIKTT